MTFWPIFRPSRFIYIAFDGFIVDHGSSWRRAGSAASTLRWDLREVLRTLKPANPAMACQIALEKNNNDEYRQGCVPLPGSV
jgi:hypothetical protein